MKHTDTIALQGSIADMRTRIATEQAAMHKVRLGVARWSSNTLAPQETDASPAPAPASQTHWHAEAQCHFMCWLELGGFAHADANADADAETDTAPVMADMPAEIGSSISASAAARQATTLPAHCNGCAV